MQNQDYKQKYFALLGEVEKPARYAGGEWNIPDMNKHRKGDMVFCFPELYEIGMSNLGVAILYDIVNKTDGYVAERCYAPAPDFAQNSKKTTFRFYLSKRKNRSKISPSSVFRSASNFCTQTCFICSIWRRFLSEQRTGTIPIPYCLPADLAR